MLTGWNNREQRPYNAVDNTSSLPSSATRRVPVQRAALCIRNFPSQYRNHFRGLSGHDAGSFNATVFISMLSGGRAGVSINSPAAANTSLL